MSDASLRVITAAADLLDAQAPVVDAARRWVAADAAFAAAVQAYDAVRDSEPPTPEELRSEVMSAAVAAQRDAWAERKAAAADLTLAIAAFNAWRGR